MNIKAKGIDYIFDKNGNVQLMITVGKSALKEVDELINSQKELSVEIKPYRPKRSLDANAYLWVLLGKLSERLKVPKEEIYINYIRECGVYEVIPVQADKVDFWIKAWVSRGLGWHAEVLSESKISGYMNIITYFGTSIYNSKEMSVLIDEVVDDCKEFGIETLPPAELQALVEAYK